MVAFFNRLPNHRFLTLLPAVLLFSFSLSFLTRLLILFFFTSDAPLAWKGPKSLKSNKEELTPAISYYEDMVTGHLIRGVLEDPQAVAKGADGIELDPEISADNGDADQMLVTGTLSGHWSFARVTIREKSAQDSEEYAIGETVGGYKIVAIEAHHVVLKKGTLSLKVNVGETPAQAKERIRPKAEEGSGPVLVSSQTIQKVLSREDVNRKLKDPNAIYKNARFGPHLVEGKIEGYKLYQVAKDHIFYSLGARSGDVIRRVNGMPLSDTEKMLELWNSVKLASKITVDLERQGKIITYEFIIRN